MAKRKQAKKTVNQLAFEKEVKRVKAFVKRAEKRGYIFDKNAIDAITKKPARVTKKALEELKSATTATRLYAKSQYIKAIDNESGNAVLVVGSEGRKIEREKASAKAQRTRAERGAIEVADVSIIDTLKSVLEEIAGTRYVSGGRAVDLDRIHNNLVTALDNRLSELDEGTVEYKAYLNHLQLDVEDAKGNILDVVYYDSAIEQVQISTAKILKYINWRALTEAEAKEAEDYDFDFSDDDWDF